MPVPEFVRRLRAHVGHDLLWLVGVSAVVLDDDDRVLLARRADDGLWATVDGILEPGEQPAVAVVREVAEETGVRADVVSLAAVAAGDPVTYPNGDVAQYLSLTFWCRAAGGEAHVADDENLEVGWFALDALPAPLTDRSHERVERVLAHRAAARGSGHVGQPFWHRP